MFHFSQWFQRQRTKGYFRSSMGSIWFSLSHSTTAITWQARLRFVLKDILMAAKEESTMQSIGVLFDVESPWIVGFSERAQPVHEFTPPAFQHAHSVRVDKAFAKSSKHLLTFPSSSLPRLWMHPRYRRNSSSLLLFTRRLSALPLIQSFLCRPAPSFTGMARYLQFLHLPFLLPCINDLLTGMLL